MNSVGKSTEESELRQVKSNAVAQDILVQENNEQSSELPEDMEMIGPGQMLADGRKKLGLTPEYIAKTLNFRLLLVNNIEIDCFDSSLPDTFNKGYLRNYAKLVKVGVDDVLTSYDALGAANIQRTEMQSFSNLVVKQAEHSRIMWVSYLIIAILAGSTIMWWVQDSQQHESSQKKIINEVALNKAIASNTDALVTITKNESVQKQQISKKTEITLNDKSGQNSDTENVVISSTKAQIQQSTIQQVIQQAIPPQGKQSTTVADTLLSTAVFTFSGDCWVNIYDSNKERIAWGIKKQGYVMTVTGKPPLSITLGKPELATIVFNGESVDMSPYNAGNIAKFTLPITP